MECIQKIRISGTQGWDHRQILIKLKCFRFISSATFYKTSKPSFVLDKLTILISLHDKLTENVTLINELFSTEVFFILMSIFTYSLFGSFSRYMWVNDVDA